MRVKKYLERLERPTVVAHLKGGTSIRGVLASVHDDVIVLKDAAHLSDNGGAIALDGDQLIPRTNVDFLQRLGGAE